MKKQAHPIRNILYGLLTLSVVCLVVAAVWYGTRVVSLTITDVNISGGETIDHQVVRNTVETELAGDYLALVPRRFVWTYPKEDIVNALISLERLHNLTVERKKQTLTVTFDEYVPQALWCESRDSERCVFLTKNGYAFAPAPSLSGGSFTRYVTLGKELVAGKQAIEKNDYLALQELQQLLDQELGWQVTTIELDKERDAFIHLVGGGELKTTLTQPPRVTIENLRTVLLSENFTHITADNFEYIDLRFGNKVFVNEFGDPNELIATSTASSTE